MKICKYCGTKQNDGNYYCMDCNRPLDLPLTKGEEDQFNETVSERIKQQLTDEREDFFVSRLDKVVCIVLLLGAILHIGTLIFVNSFLQEYGLIEITWIAVILMVVSAICVAFPSIIWKLYKLRF